ncbi:MAG: beta family protein [Hydrotalea sp.]|nr:beta family protein [Hydrotalea sp.]
MINHTTYVPVIKWKLGEYKALSELKDSTKDKIIPLIEIPRIGYDFENSSASKTIDEHLEKFIKRLKSKWPSRPCFIDTCHIHEEHMADGNSSTKYIFNNLKDFSGPFIPVVYISSNEDYIKDISITTHLIKKVCLRITPHDLDIDNLDNKIQTILDSLKCTQDDSFLVIDIKDNDLPIGIHSEILKRIPFANRWQMVVIIGGHYPKESIRAGTYDIPRKEWITYKKIYKVTSDEGVRIPSFGDYLVGTSDYPKEFDMRLIKPLAKVRYTHDDHWYVVVGKNVRLADGFRQYRNICNYIISKPFFDGKYFSKGDEYIETCAKGGSHGNLGTWVYVAMNRHMEKVVADIAKLAAT